MPTRVLPDAEAVAIAWLVAHPEVAAAGIHVSDGLGPRPCARLSRVGGTPAIAVHLDRARLDVDVYADTKEQARDTAALLHGALHEMRGRVAGAWVTGVEDDLGLTWLPDPDTGEPRYTFAVRVYAHP